MIDKVGGIILKDKKILVQRKNNNREECIFPGGKREGKETDFETLKRELQEELSVELLKIEYIGTYQDIAVFSNKPLQVITYLAKIKGKIKCNNEIKEAIWIDKDYKKQGIKVGSILEKYVIPELVKRNLM
ncbi:MAG TPA: NUDIX domain-containing protein [Candidatus Faecimonas gallistercoris]|nr:NUDIX domain-containing protein [Candidatus Faecimonas gallistercoris]